MSTKIGVAMYGLNGHQIHHLLDKDRPARLVAIAAFDPAKLPEPLAKDAGIRRYDSLDAILKDAEVQLVSLCSPRRADQPRDAIRALEAGKHVYAEKPAATSEEDLDAILAAAQRAGRRFHEMAGTAFDQPYFAMRRIVQAGTLGQIVQVIAQKSYPYHDGRPQDEAVDGGITAQAGVHALRFIEHVACEPVAEVTAIETTRGNPIDGGGLRMACCMMMRLASGGVATATANYLNPRGFGQWGNEMLRIFGTKGVLESTDGGTRTRLIVGDRDLGPIDASARGIEYFDAFLDEVLAGKPMPFSTEEELHPTRIVLRAKAAAGRATSAS